MSDTTGMRWHTVRMVDDATPPHCVDDSFAVGVWPRLRGKVVRVSLFGKQSELRRFCSVECECELLFYVHREDWPERISQPFVCRRMLEMD